MSDQWINVRFDVSTRILDSDVEFHDGSKLRLGPERTEEKLFRDAKTGKTLDTKELISYLLQKSGVTKQSLVTPAAAAEAFEKGICVGSRASIYRLRPVPRYSTVTTAGATLSESCSMWSSLSAPKRTRSAYLLRNYELR